MKKYLLPVGAGVVVFGVVTAFAASLTVNSDGLAAGNGDVNACNTSASLTGFTTSVVTDSASPLVGKYVVTGATLSTLAGTGGGNSPCGNKSFKVQLLDTNNAVVGTEATGTLGATSGSAAVTFGSSNVLASAVSHLAVVITG